MRLKTFSPQARKQQECTLVVAHLAFGEQQADRSP
jgi:hypothetical protein